MELDELLNAMYSIARQSHHEEVKEQVYILARDVGRNGVSGPTPDELNEHYPFSRLINDLEALADQARYTIDMIELMALREQLLTEGIDCQVKQ